MDTHEYHDWLLHCRIRSARQRKRMQRKDEEKQLLRMWRKEWDIRKEINTLGWVELKRPEQRGYIRYFVLRDDVARSRDASLYRKVLDKINTQQWSYRKDFMKKRRRFGKKIYTLREQSLLDVDERTFLGKKFTDGERLLFEPRIIRYGKMTKFERVFRFQEPWRFILKVQPLMITKVRVKNLDLEHELAEIDRFFTFEKRNRLCKILGERNWRFGCPKKKDLDPFVGRSFADALNEYWPPQPVMTTTKAPSEFPGVFCCIQSKQSISLGTLRRLRLRTLRRFLPPSFRDS